VNGLLVEQVETEHLIYRSDSVDAAALNEAAAAVFALCDGQRDVDAIVTALRDDGRDLGRDEVLLALRELAEAGLIDSTPVETGPSRRDLLRRLGAGTIAAVAIPVVELISGPSMAAASTARGVRAANGTIVSAPAAVTISFAGQVMKEPDFTG
jgi:Coenzyme PQQ synthesis protein D (PqqD)